MQTQPNQIGQRPKGTASVFLRVFRWAMVAFTVLGAIFWLVFSGVALFSEGPFKFNDQSISKTSFVMFGLAVLVVWVGIGTVMFFAATKALRALESAAPNPDQALTGSQIQPGSSHCPSLWFRLTPEGKLISRPSRARYGAALLVFALGAFFVVLGVVSKPEDFEAGTPTIGIAIGAIIITIAGAIALWTNELILDPAARTYRWVRGVRPFARRRAGTFEDLSHLSLEYQAGDSDSPSTWRTYLVWRGEPGPRFLLAERAAAWAEQATQDGESFGQWLGLSFRDNTGRFQFSAAEPDSSERTAGPGPTKVRRSVLSSDEDLFGSLPPLPARGAMWRRTQPGVVVVAARTSFTVSVFALVFFLALVGGGLVQYDPTEPSPVWLRLLHKGVFWLSLLLLVPWWFCGDCLMTVDGKHLAIRLQLLGLTVQRRVLAWDDITVIDARSDRIRVGLRGVLKTSPLGWYLSERQRLWLIEVIRTCLARRTGEKPLNREK